MRVRLKHSLPADVVAGARVQLYVHMIRIVTPFNSGAGGRLSVAAVVLNGHCVLTDHTLADIVQTYYPEIHYATNVCERTPPRAMSSPMFVSARPV